MTPENLPIEHLRRLRATLDIGPISLTALTPLERVAAAVCQLSCILIDETIREKEGKDGQDALYRSAVERGG